MKLPRYPSEIVPLFLYLGERCHAYNAAMNYDLKIHAHVSLGHGLEAAYPGTIAELHYDVRDEPGQDLLSKFDEIFDFLGMYIYSQQLYTMSQFNFNFFFFFFLNRIPSKEK